MLMITPWKMQSEDHTPGLAHVERALLIFWSANVIKMLRHKYKNKPEQESDGQNNHRQDKNEID